ncbi:MAG: DUF362 domain-containing protein [Elusimicrobiota bacterium]
MSKVSIVKCSTYSQNVLFDAVKHSVGLVGGIDAFVKSGEKVLLKPNLLMAAVPEKGITTHPEFIRAVIRLVKTAGGVVSLGDSYGGTSDSVDKVWGDTGMLKLAQEEGVELVKLETSGVREFKLSNGLPELYVSNTVFEFDKVISLPKLKTHALTTFTCAVKNMYGVIPGVRKSDYHRFLPSPDEFCVLLSELVIKIPPVLTIVDGIIGMEGDGPSAGILRECGLILAGSSVFEIDEVTARIMGVPDELNPMKKAYMSLGVNISPEIVGETMESAKIPGFVLPSTKSVQSILLTYLPKWLQKMLMRMFRMHMKINTKKCVLCMTCYKRCPKNAITKNRKKLKINLNTCVSCMCCHELCKYKAVDLEYTLFARVLLKIKSFGKINSNKKK